MFKTKSLVAALSLFLFVCAGLAYAGNADTEDVRLNRSGVYDRSLGAYVTRASSSGHITNETGLGELGSPAYPWFKVYVGTNGIVTSTGVARQHEYFSDLPASDDDIIRDDGALTLSTLFTGGTTYTAADLTQPTVPRNIIVFASVTVSNVSITTASVTGRVYIRGIDAMGRSTFTYQTLVTTTGATVGLGDIAWARISSMTVIVTSTGGVTSNVGNNAVAIQIGTGDKIGLCNKIDSVNDIYQVNEAGTVTTTYTANAVYSTIDFASDGNASRDYDVRYIQKYFTPLP